MDHSHFLINFSITLVDRLTVVNATRGDVINLHIPEAYFISAYRITFTNLFIGFLLTQSVHIQKHISSTVFQFISSSDLRHLRTQTTLSNAKQINIWNHVSS